MNNRWHGIWLMALTVALGAATVAFAQAPAPPPAYGGPPAGGPYGPAPFPGGSGYGPFPPAPGGTARLPEGVERIYALQGDNSIYLQATPEGYERVRELVRHLDGDLDIIRTDAVRVNVRRSDLERLGVTLGGEAGLSPQAAGKLVAAFKAGQLRPSQAVRILTREDTVVDTFLSAARRSPNSSRAAPTPLTLVPREGRNSAVTLELQQPLSATCSAQSGETAVLVLPGGETGSAASLLFLTPTVLPSSARR